MAKLSKRTCSCLIILTFGHSPLIIWMRPNRNITATPKHSLNIFANQRRWNVLRPQAIRRTFASFRFRGSESSQLCAKFSPISQLSSNFLAIFQLMVNFNKSVNIFPAILYSWTFYLKNPKRIHQLVSDVQRRLHQHDCF